MSKDEQEKKTREIFLTETYVYMYVCVCGVVWSGVSPGQG